MSLEKGALKAQEVYVQWGDMTELKGERQFCSRNENKNQ